MSVTKYAGPIAFAFVMAFSLAERTEAQVAGRVSTTEAGPLAKDIDPVTRYRLPLATRADMRDDAERKIYDDMTKGVQQPLHLLSPKFAKPMSEARRYLKFDTGIDNRLIEIAVLVTARGLNHQFEWTQWEAHGSHAPGAGKPELEQPIIDIIKYCKPVTGLAPKDAAIIKYGRELFGPNKKVSSETFAEALRLFGKRGVVDITGMMAQYTATAMEVNAYDTRLDEGQKLLLPPLKDTPLCPQ
jgi:4-carboxymuconolactone decarboxylase